MIRSWWYVILGCVILIVSQISPFLFSVSDNDVIIKEVSNIDNEFGFLSQGNYTSINVTPENTAVLEGDNFTIDIYCTPHKPMVAYEFKIAFNPTIVNAQSVVRGNIFNEFITIFSPGIIDNENGTIINIYEVLWPASQGNVSDGGILASISFNVTSSCDDLILDLYDVGITNEEEYINISVSDGMLSVLCAYTFIWENEDVGYYWFQLLLNNNLIVNLTDVCPFNYPNNCSIMFDNVLFNMTLQKGIYYYRVKPYLREK